MATGTPIKTFTDRDGNKHQVIGTGAGTGLNGHLAEFDENGQIKDGGAKSQFAAAVHSHDMIKKEGIGTYEGDSAAIVTGVDSIDIEIEKSGTLYNAEIDSTNFANLQRALQDPAAPALGGTKLITNGQVYAALSGHVYAMKTLRINYNSNTGVFYNDTTGKELLAAFMNGVLEETYVPVVVDLYEGSTKDSEAVGFARWEDTGDTIKVVVLFYNAKFSATGQYQDDPSEAVLGSWSRSFVGQSFFS